MTAPTDVTTLAAFLEAFSSYEGRMQQSHIREEKAKIGALLRGIRSLDATLAHFRKLQAPQYNLFEILNIRHLEAKVHTPFLGNLLDPRGSHSQGQLFLRSFLTQVAGRPDFLEGLRHIEVIEELGTRGQGFVDLIIRGRNEKGPFAIVVENKIYAKDQDEQLKRYHKYLTQTLLLPPCRYLLIYLTPHGAQPSIPESISQDDYTSLTKTGGLLLRSYKEDIRQWLEALLPDIPAPKVNYTLKQYLQIINRL